MTARLINNNSRPVLRVLKEGDPRAVEPATFQGTCPVCGCVFEYAYPEDATFRPDRQLYQDCPTPRCGMEVVCVRVKATE